MIKQVKKIRDFGVYRDFSWEKAIPDFEKINLIYGWNYSGKTTFSELFRSIEFKKLNENWDGSKFKLIMESQKQFTEKDLEDFPFNVKVFNRNFVEENLNFKEGRANSILILGKENFDLKKEVEKIEEEKQTVTKEKKRLKDYMNTKEDEKNEELKLLAKTIKEILHLYSVFTQSNVKKHISSLKENYEIHILEEEELQKKKKTCLGTGDQKEVPELDLKSHDLVEELIEVEQILKKVPNSPNSISELKNDSQLESWVKTGIELHNETTTCKFCENVFDPKLIHKLNQHFSKEHTELMSSIQSKLTTLNVKKQNDWKFTDEVRLLPEFRDDYSNELKELKRKISSYNDAINSPILKLEQKRKNPYLEISINSSEVEKIDFSPVNQIIKKNNLAIKNLEKNKKDIETELIEHYIAKSMKENNFHQREKEISDLKKTIDDKSDSISSMNGKINEKQTKISSIHSGARELNELLSAYNPEINITIEPKEPDDFQVIRGKKIAKNLSEGEKTAISFVYFLTKLKDKDTDLKETIVFIDDPISSFDTNHIFKAHSMILSELIGKAVDDRKVDIAPKQLFISTHNLQFFHLIKDRIESKLEKKTSFYLIEAKEDQNGRYSEIKNIPNHIKKFRSEHVYLYYLLDQFIENEKFEDFLYVMPNVLRRFLESYLGLRKPDGSGWTGKLNLLFDDGRDRERVKKIADYYSHQGSADRALMVYPYQEVKPVIELTIKRLRETDKDHYDALDSIK